MAIVKRSRVEPVWIEKTRYKKFKKTETQKVSEMRREYSGWHKKDMNRENDSSRQEDPRLEFLPRLKSFFLLFKFFLFLGGRYLFLGESLSLNTRLRLVTSFLIY